MSQRADGQNPKRSGSGKSSSEATATSYDRKGRDSVDSEADTERQSMSAAVRVTATKGVLTAPKSPSHSTKSGDRRSE